MISAFGERAKQYATQAGELNAVICEPHTIAEGYLEAVRRREAGDCFYGMLLFDDTRIMFGHQHGEEILAQIPDFDHRRIVLDQIASGDLAINGAQKVAEVYNAQPPWEYVAIEFFAMSDAMLVRSWADYGRITQMFMRGAIRRPVRPVERVLATSVVPVVERVRPMRPGIVIWAPQRPAVALAIPLHGLAEFHGDITCVTAGGSQPSRTFATFVSRDDPRTAQALATAAVVLCLEPNDPADAVAFARLGYGVVAPVTSGAHEFAGDIVAWDAIDARFLFTLVGVAMARPASVRSEPVAPPVAPSRPPRPAFVPATELPLVSIITPTYQRRDHLRKSLTNMALQTYPNIEQVVVNDGGIAVDDIVAEFPHARLIDLKENVGAARAFEIGRENVKGEYIAVLPDDDWVYPDHFERLLNAIFQSGAPLAHGTALLRYLEDQPGGGGARTIGYNATTFSQTLLPSDTLITSTIGTQQAVVPAKIYDEIGWYLSDNDVSDNEIQARICKKYFYAFVDHVTSEFRDHAGGRGRSVNFVTALKHVYDVIHPVHDRPLITQIRQQTLANIAGRPAGQPPFPMTISLK